MDSCEHKKGFTLIEILTVVAIIAVLASIVISVATRIETRGEKQVAEATFAIIDATLQQFQDYGYQYTDPGYSDFDFPLDCNGFDEPELVDTIAAALGLLPADVLISINGLGTHDPNYSGSEAMYFFLSRIPECRITLDKIDSSLVTNENSDGGKLQIDIDNTNVATNRVYPLFRIIDPWGKTLHYDYYEEVSPPSLPDPGTKKNFPVIISAGPDGLFGTADDITNR